MENNYLWYRIRQRCRYVMKARHWKGHGIHSPFVYSLICDVFECSHPYYCFDSLEAQRRTLPKQLSRKCLSARQLQRLFRLLQTMQVTELCCLGQPDVMTQAYLQAARLTNLSFPAVLPVGYSAALLCPQLDLAGYEASLQGCLDGASTRSLAMIWGINQGSVKRKLWQQTCDDSRVTFSLETHNMGLLFFRKELNKAHYVYRCM